MNCVALRDDKTRSTRLLQEICTNDDHGALDELLGKPCLITDLDHDEAAATPSLIDLINAYKAFAPDLRFSVDEQAGEGRTVITCWSAAGTHSGIAQHIVPTGRPIRLHGSLIRRGTRRGPGEVRGMWDVGGFVHQIGVSRARFERMLMTAAGAVTLRTVYKHSGTPVLFFPTMSLPGWTTWRQFLDQVASNRPVITYQLIANRWALERREMPSDYSIKSENRALRVALNEAGAKGPFDIVGHSAGGTLALDFALDYPEHVRSLVLIEPGLAWLLSSSGLLSGKLQRVITRRESWYAGRLTPTRYAAFLRATYGEQDYEPTRSPRWPMMCAYMWNMRFRQALFRHRDDPRRLDSLRCPVLLIQGRNSDPFHRAGMQLLRSRIVGAQFVEMDGGHVPHYGAGVEPFLALLEGFHASVQPLMAAY